MNSFSLVDNLRASIERPMLVPGQGETAVRHLRLMELGREDLELARLAEAHWDALAILAEAGYMASGLRQRLASRWFFGQTERLLS
jgi:hypothetical protein